MALRKCKYEFMLFNSLSALGLSLISLAALGQSDFKYMSLESSHFFSDTVSLYKFRSEFDRIKTKGFSLEKILPAGYVKDGSVDYTKYIQKALNTYHYVVFPPFPLLVDDNGLVFRSDTYVIFKKGSKLIKTPTAKGDYRVVRIENVNSVFLFNPVIVGERYEHKDKIGEWGIGVYLFNAHDIVIFSPTISKCWGDGVYISGGKTPSSNIGIYNAYCDDNRRNAISIINVDTLRMTNILVSNTFGTNPMAGIDVEPNNNQDIINNLYLKNVYTINNYNVGIKIQLGNLLGADKEKNINIDILDHYSFGSAFSCFFARVEEKEDMSRSKIRPLNGHILIQSPTWSDFRKKPITVSEYGTLGPKISVTEPVIGTGIDKNGTSDILDKSHLLDRNKSIQYLNEIVNKKTMIVIQ